MLSVLSYGRLVARAVIGGLSQTDSRDYSLVTASCGFGKDFRKGILKKGMCYGDDACFIARHRSADVLGEWVCCFVCFGDIKPWLVRHQLAVWRVGGQRSRSLCEARKYIIHIIKYIFIFLGFIWKSVAANSSLKINVQKSFFLSVWFKKKKKEQNYSEHI